MNDIEHEAPGDDRRPRVPKMKFRVPAVAALEARRDFAFIGQAATFTERRMNETHALPATHPNVAFGRHRKFGITELTDWRVEKSEPGIKPAFHADSKRRPIH